MYEASRPREINVRTIREREVEPGGNEWIGLSPSERIEGVWMLTMLCLAWNNQLKDEPRLQRTLIRIQRKRG